MLRAAIRRTFSTSRMSSTASESVSNRFKIHNVARNGFDAGGSSGLYDRARPAYPQDAISTMLREAASPTGTPLRIVELGAGTGICTRMLLADATATAGDGTPPAGVASLRAIEPSAGMRSHFAKNIADPQDGLVGLLQRKGQLAPAVEVTVDDGTFEDFEAGEGNDLVVIAQAFHWCQNFDQALSNAAKTLRPGGVLALIWNLEDRDAAAWVGKLRDFYEQYEADTPQYRHNYWHAMYDTPSITLFTADEPRSFVRSLPTTLEGVKDRVLSKSYISLLSAKEQDQLKTQINDLFSSSDDELQRKWIDKQQGVWEYPYRTDLFLFRRK